MSYHVYDIRSKTWERH